MTIVFIAIILLSALAALILIDAGEAVVQHADRTAKQVEAQISSGVKVVSVIGRVGNDGMVGELEILIKKKAGSPNVDLRKMDVLYVFNGIDKSLNFGGMGAENANSDNFGISKGRNFGIPKEYMLTDIGDIAKVIINTGEIEPDGGLNTSEEARIELLPEVGFKTSYYVYIHPDIVFKKVAYL